MRGVVCCEGGGLLCVCVHVCGSVVAMDCCDVVVCCRGGL